MKRLVSVILILALAPVVRADVDFAHDVVPILKAHCAECHTDKKSEGGFSFNTRKLLLESGHVDHDKPAESRLLKLITSRDPEDQMPPRDKARLSGEEVAVLKKWVAEGTPWEAGFRFAASSYEPPLQPRAVRLPPETSDRRNPIDRLLQPYYEANGIQPPATVNDQAFLRRVSMDLVGLPPGIDEQEKFLSRPAESRREQTINNLLERKHDYAEHWITFWNDLLRNDYAGTGYIDGGRKQISVWLYRALLNNVPYDQFVRELIAPTAESEGFINGIKWRGNVNASQVREIQFAQSVSQVFLGINMKCASCHDSFIDRWTLEEAYGLAAIYSKRDLEIHRCDKPTGRTAKARWIFPSLGEVDATAPQTERLRQLSVLMTSPQNGRFARTIVNRLWHRFFGHGIVHPVDAMHTEPWNEDLLDFLANYLVENKYDLKKVMKLMVQSDAYGAVTSAAEDWATSDEFVFRGPEPKHVTAEQFMDSVWRLTDSAPQSINAPIPSELYHDGPMAQVTKAGKWIWTYADAAGSPAGETGAFRKTVEIEKLPKRANLVITCDNEYTAWVNGKKVGADKNWPTVEVINIRRHLKAGKNEFFIVGRNAGNSPNAAGLYASIILTGEDSTQIATDETWQASRKVPKPQHLSAVEWTHAAPVLNQDFLGPSIDATIAAQLSAAATDTSRTARASLLRSTLLMRSLGRPNREQIVTTRPPSLSTLQAIDLANGAILDKILATGGSKMLSEAQGRSGFVESSFQIAICREPSEREARLARSILGESPTADTVQDFLWTLVMLPEFQFVQ